MKSYNGFYNVNKIKFNIFCIFGFHQWWWTRGMDDKQETRCAVKCDKCNEIRMLSPKNSDMHDMKEIRKTINLSSWEPVYFNWKPFSFHISGSKISSLD